MGNKNSKNKKKISPLLSEMTKKTKYSYNVALCRDDLHIVDDDINFDSFSGIYDFITIQLFYDSIALIDTENSNNIYGKINYEHIKCWNSFHEGFYEQFIFELRSENPGADLISFGFKTIEDLLHFKVSFMKHIYQYMYDLGECSLKFMNEKIKELEKEEQENER